MSADNRKTIAMIGNAEVGYHLTEALLKEHLPIAHIITLDPELASRHNVSGYRDFTPLANEYNIPVYYPRSFTLDDPEDLAFFQQAGIGLLLQGGWQRLFPASILETLRIGCVGIHGSADFLPRGRGRSPLNWSLIEGRKRFLLHLFLMKAGIDDGDVFAVGQFDINAHDDIRTLYYKNSILTRQLLLRSIPELLDGTISLWTQEGEPTHYPKRTPEDGKIDWEWDMETIYDFIRAQTRPYPGAFAHCNGQMIRIWKSQPFDRSIHYPKARIGEIVEVLDGNLIVNASGGLLIISDYEPHSQLTIGDQLT